MTTQTTGQKIMGRTETIGAIACAFIIAAGVLVDLGFFGTATACGVVAAALAISIAPL